MGSPKYDRENTRRINLKLNNKTDADIIQQLEALKKTEGIQTYLKRLIREGIGRSERDQLKGDQLHEYQKALAELQTMPADETDKAEKVFEGTMALFEKLRRK